MYFRRCRDSTSSAVFSLNTQFQESDSLKALVSSASQTFTQWTHSQYFAVAAAAGGSQELLVAVLAVDRSLLLHKAGVCQRRAAVGAVELLLVPGPPHGHQERSSGGRGG